MIYDMQLLDNDWIFYISDNDPEKVLTPIMILVDLLVWMLEGGHTYIGKDGSRYINLIISTPHGEFVKEWPVDPNQNSLLYQELIKNHMDDISPEVIEQLAKTLNIT